MESSPAFSWRSAGGNGLESSLGRGIGSRNSIRRLEMIVTRLPGAHLLAVQGTLIVIADSESGSFQQEDSNERVR